MHPDVHVYMYIHTYTRDRHESILGIIKTTILPNSQEKICITTFLSEQHPLEADCMTLYYCCGNHPSIRIIFQKHLVSSILQRTSSSKNVNPCFIKFILNKLQPIQLSLNKCFKRTLMK